MPGSAGALRRGVGGLPAESATGPGSGNRPGTLAPSPANRLGFDGEGVPHAQEGRGLCYWGDRTRHRSPSCEAIDMAVRRCPYATGGDGIPLDSTRTGGASTPLSSSPSIWGDMRSSLPRAGPGCAGRVPGRKPAGATLKNERVYQMVHRRKKQGRPGYCLPGRAGIHDQK